MASVGHSCLALQQYDRLVLAISQEIELLHMQKREHTVLARIFASGGTLCIINDLGSLVNNGCGQLHVRELQCKEAKQYKS